MHISYLERYIVKGLRSESLKSVELNFGAGMPLDRHFAFTHTSSEFNFQNPQWIKRRNFLVVAHSPLLASIESRMSQDSKLLELRCGSESFVVNLENKSGLKEANEFLTSYLADFQSGPYQLVSVPQVSLTDHPSNTISLMNLASLRRIESDLGHELGVGRFRGNLWFEGDSAWQERNWIGSEIRINNVVLRLVENIVRCPTVDTNAFSGLRDHQVVKCLNKNYGHAEFGVLAEVISSGTISVGDQLVSELD